MLLLLVVIVGSVGIRHYIKLHMLAFAALLDNIFVSCDSGYSGKRADGLDYGNCYWNYYSYLGFLKYPIAEPFSTQSFTQR